MRTIKKGDRIPTDHGMATVIGFERFTAQGNSAPMADNQQGKERIIAALDSGHTWPNDGNYAVYHHELTK